MMSVTVVVVFVDLIVFITIIRSDVCVMIFVHVCAVYCIPFTPLGITSVHMICLVFHKIILPVFVTYIQ